MHFNTVLTEITAFKIEITFLEIELTFQIIWLLIMWHIPNLMLQVAPKKHRTPSGQENEGAKANHPVYSSVCQEIAPEDIA